MDPRYARAVRDVMQADVRKKVAGAASERLKASERALSPVALAFVEATYHPDKRLGS